MYIAWHWTIKLMKKKKGPDYSVQVGGCSNYPVYWDPNGGVYYHGSCGTFCIGEAESRYEAERIAMDWDGAGD